MSAGARRRLAHPREPAARAAPMRDCIKDLCGGGRGRRAVPAAASGSGKRGQRPMGRGAGAVVGVQLRRHQAQGGEAAGDCKA